MAIINCPECDTKISDKAEKCPKCAYPISCTQTQEKIQTIELTSKKYKKEMIFAVIATIIGIIIMVSTASEGSDWASFGGLLMFVGIVCLFVVKIKVWWHHK